MVRVFFCLLPLDIIIIIISCCCCFPWLQHRHRTLRLGDEVGAQLEAAGAQLLDSNGQLELLCCRQPHNLRLVSRGDRVVEFRRCTNASSAINSISSISCISYISYISAISSINSTNSSSSTNSIADFVANRRLLGVVAVVCSC